MKADEFNSTMCRLKRQEPFEPFVVELLDGTSIVVERPHPLAFDGEGATLVTHKDELVEFYCSEVRAIRMAPREAVS